MDLKRTMGVAAVCATVMAAFAYGVGVGRYEWPPFAAIVAVKGWLVGTPDPQSNGDSLDEPYAGEAELLKYAFTGPLIDGPLLLTPAETLDDLSSRQETIFTDAAAPFDIDEVRLDAVRSERAGNRPLVVVPFRQASSDRRAYAYGSNDSGCGSDGSAALVIPGTGHNQSSSIFDGAPGNYHGPIVAALREGGFDDVYVLVKPNEDVRAVHDGTNKLNYEFVHNHHLNRGGSYSASYIVESIAFMQFLKSCYGTTAIAGLSQGGKAALLNALQTEPDLSLIASGYSVISQDLIEWSGFGQVVIPGVAEILHPDALGPALEASATNWLFTYGEQEIGLFRIEAVERRTCDAFAAIPNVQCVVHAGGHVFPEQEIVDFVQQAGR